MCLFESQQFGCIGIDQHHLVVNWFRRGATITEVASMVGSTMLTTAASDVCVVGDSVVIGIGVIRGGCAISRIGISTSM